MTRFEPLDATAEPARSAALGPARRPMFSALTVRNYRVYALSNLVSTTTGQVSRVAQDWVMLELTGSAAAIGLTMACQFTPILTLGLWGGILADRYPKRRLLMVTQAVSVAVSLTLAALILTGEVEAWHIYALALVHGLASVVEGPARLSFAGELAGRSMLPNAISLGTSTFQLGALTGPALAGALIVWQGAGWAFAINAAGAAFVVACMVMIRERDLYDVPAGGRAKGQLREGLRHAARRPEIVWTLAVVAVVAAFTQTFPVTLAAFAADVFEVGAGGYGAFTTAMAVGALAGGLLSTRRRRTGLLRVLGAAIATTACVAVAATMPTLLTFSAGVAACGAVWMVFITGANTLLQSAADPALRGRIVAMYVVVLTGGQVLGGPLVGWIVETGGARVGLALAGAVPFLAVCAMAVGLRHARRQAGAGPASRW